jgi:hypothetical protein
MGGIKEVGKEEIVGYQCLRTWYYYLSEADYLYLGQHIRSEGVATLKIWGFNRD